MVKARRTAIARLVPDTFGATRLNRPSRLSSYSLPYATSTLQQQRFLDSAEVAETHRSAQGVRLGTETTWRLRSADDYCDSKLTVHRNDILVYCFSSQLSVFSSTVFRYGSRWRFAPTQSPSISGWNHDVLARSDLGKHRNMSRTYRLSASHCQKNQHSQRARVSHLRVLQFPEAEIGIAYQPCRWPVQTHRTIIDGIFCYRTRLPSTPSLAPNRLWSSLSLESAKERISRVSASPAWLCNAYRIAHCPIRSTSA